MMVRLRSAVLGPDGGQVVRPRVREESQRLPGAAFADAGCTTPSRQPQPLRIRG